jgi:hypothetical protein
MSEIYIIRATYKPGWLRRSCLIEATQKVKQLLANLYFKDPGDHLLEIITRPYGSGG